MNRSDLQKLNAAVEFLLRQESFASTVEHLRGELLRTEEPFVWSTVPLDSIACELPAGIKSCWVFHLRKGVPSGCHYHPNSVQHMVVVYGQGTSNVGGRRSTMVPFASPEHSLDGAWHIIEEGVPHEFVPEREEMTVVSFHTCEAAELEEIACETGGKRVYESSDAKQALQLDKAPARRR